MIGLRGSLYFYIWPAVCAQAEMRVSMARSSGAVVVQLRIVPRAAVLRLGLSASGGRDIRRQPPNARVDGGRMSVCTVRMLRLRNLAVTC
jgi:hypothetical protein